jgi:hypothetical protein
LLLHARVLRLRLQTPNALLTDEDYTAFRQGRQVIMSPAMSNHSKGLQLVAVSALLFSTPGLFTCGVSASGWDVIFGRAVFGMRFTALYLGWRGTLKTQMASLGKSRWADAMVWASGTTAYRQAYKLTSIANVSLIYGGAPSLTARLGVVGIAQGSLGTAHLAGGLLALWMACTRAIGLSIFRQHPLRLRP